MVSNRFRIPPRVVHETIDGEVILIQIETGYYYSLGGSGAEMWALLHRGHSVGEAAGELVGRFDADEAELTAAVGRLADELRGEGLLEPAEGEAAPANGDGPSGGGERRPFVQPVLERYEDMQDFLLVDPIHEVDDTGWPNTKPA